MAYAQSIVGNVFTSAGGATEMYGAWYEGQQGKQYYMTQAALTWRQKEEASRAADMQERQAAYLQSQADEAKLEAEYTKQQGDLAEEQFQRDTAAGVATLTAKTAHEGVVVSYGSPLEYLNSVADNRARDLSILDWDNDVNVWTKERQAADIQDKATIMLDTFKVNRSNLPMYDYQTMLYSEAAQEAEKVADQKRRAIILKTLVKASSQWSMGGGGGEGGGAGGTGGGEGGGGSGGGGGG